MSVTKYVDDLALQENILKTKEHIEEVRTQYAVMPTASVDLLNKIYQFVGTTTATYTNGSFYKCVYDSGLDTYLWQALSSGGGGSDLDVDGTTIVKNENNIISAATATNASKGIVTAGDGTSIDEDGKVNVVNRLVITQALPTASSTLVGVVRLLTANQSGYQKGGIYQCQQTDTNVYDWVLIAIASVDPTELSNAIANDVQSRNLLIFSE